MNLRILQVTGEMNRGGAEVMLMNLYRNISPDTKFDFLINLRCLNNRFKGDFDDEILELGGSLNYIGSQWRLGPVKYILEFRKVIAKVGKPDVVHIHLNSKCGIIALAAKVCGVRKIIAHSHADLKFRGSFLNILLSEIELRIQKVLIRKFATDFWGCSEEANLRLYSKSLVKKRKTLVINNAIDISKFMRVRNDKINRLRESYGAKSTTLVLGNVGRVVKHKNIKFIVEVLSELNKRGVDCLFVYAGRVDDIVYGQAIRRAAEDYGLASQVLSIGDRDDIPEVMSSFDVFLGPALLEGFGLVAVEAQAAGIPCLLYKGFPASVDMGLGLVDFLKDFDVNNWANLVVESKHKRITNKEMIFKAISERGYDVVNNATWLEELYKI